MLPSNPIGVVDGVTPTDLPGLARVGATLRVIGDPTGVAAAVRIRKGARKPCETLLSGP